MKLSIFLMEDDEEDHFILSLAFSRIGLRECVTFFSSGNALMKKLYEVPVHEYPNLIGLDCHMPRYSGEDELILLKNHSKWQAIPVVLFSHNMTTRLRQKSMSLGALACLEKTSSYLDYMKLPQRLLELIAFKNQRDENHNLG
ncbi:MAG: response regulator [Segetibacter sp.]|nr:response regulator [Segetibacter sp.]